MKSMKVLIMMDFLGDFHIYLVVDLLTGGELFDSKNNNEFDRNY